jgi:hypothetical protein
MIAMPLVYFPPGPRPRRQFADRREIRQGDGRSRRSRGARREVDIMRSRRSRRLVCRLLQPDTNSRSGAAVSGERQGLPLRLKTRDRRRVGSIEDSLTRQA